MGTRIHVGAKPAAFYTTATYVDSKVAHPRTVALRIDEGAEALLISEGNTELACWPLKDIRRLRDQAASEGMVLKQIGLQNLARLYIEDPDTTRLLLARCDAPLRKERPMNRAKILMWSVAAMASVAVILFVLIPNMANLMADRLPAKGERALGKATFQQIRSALSEDEIVPLQTCTAPEGMAALQALGERVSRGVELDHPLQIHVLDDPMVNAFALPGGIIVFFRGMLEATQSSDELASVMAHELGHVVSKDPTRHALRSAGSIGVLGLMLGDFAGGAVVLFLTEKLIAANYSQTAELEADVFGLERLNAIGVGTGAMAMMFTRLQDAEGGPDAEGEGARFLRYFLSHPLTQDRIDIALKDGPTPQVTRPALSDAQWIALKAICD
ncbi:MAG: M48 family metallopeptidase [Pseudoruegeria sp.]